MSASTWLVCPNCKVPLRKHPMIEASYVCAPDPHSPKAYYQLDADDVLKMAEKAIDECESALDECTDELEDALDTISAQPCTSTSAGLGGSGSLVAAG